MKCKKKKNTWRTEPPLTPYWPLCKILTSSKKSSDFKYEAQECVFEAGRAKWQGTDRNSRTVQHLVHLHSKYRYITTSKYHATYSASRFSAQQSQMNTIFGDCFCHPPSLFCLGSRTHAKLGPRGGGVRAMVWTIFWRGSVFYRGSVGGQQTGG